MNQLRNSLLAVTPLLDYDNKAIQSLISIKGWKALSERNRIKAVYDFTKNDILFGYNREDGIPASEVLKDKYGQCNTKATLLMALLRGVGIPCRIHGFTIDKKLQQGAITGIWYQLAPKNIIHSWVEVWYKNNWQILEGVILDNRYLTQLHALSNPRKGTFCGYGVYVENFETHSTEWNEENTFIQHLGINRDYGTFATPDDFYIQYGSNLKGIKQWIFDNIVRKVMNQNIQRIRNR